jgi:hypothetical protein
MARGRLVEAVSSIGIGNTTSVKAMGDMTDWEEDKRPG